MGFSDLRYGWQRERLELTDVRIISSTELQHSDKDGDWTSRDPRFSGLSRGTESEAEQRAGATEFESVEAVRYVRRRSLLAKARPTGFDKIFLGVPEDRKSGGSRESRKDEVDFSIHSIKDWDPGKTGGSVSHLEARADMGHDESTYIELDVSDEVFDDVERMAIQPNVSFEASVNVRGWHWLGPIGDCEIYIDPNESERAELAGFFVTRTVREANTEVDLDADLSIPPADPLEDVRRRVTKLMPVVDSMRYAAWVSAGAAIGILIFLVFRS